MKHVMGLLLVVACSPEEPIAALDAGAPDGATIADASPPDALPAPEQPLVRPAITGFFPPYEVTIGRELAIVLEGFGDPDQIVVEIGGQEVAARVGVLGLSLLVDTPNVGEGYREVVVRSPRGMASRPIRVLNPIPTVPAGDVVVGNALWPSGPIEPGRRTLVAFPLIGILNLSELFAVDVRVDPADIGVVAPASLLVVNAPWRWPAQHVVVELDVPPGASGERTVTMFLRSRVNPALWGWSGFQRITIGAEAPARENCVLHPVFPTVVEGDGLPVQAAGQRVVFRAHGVAPGRYHIRYGASDGWDVTPNPGETELREPFLLLGWVMPAGDTQRATLSVELRRADGSGCHLTLPMVRVD